MNRNFVMEKISREADELARQYNQSQDPGIRDQWYKLLRQVSEHQEPVSPSARRLFRK